MKLLRTISMLLVVALCSLNILSSTLARYSSEYSGASTALIAKWNFRVGTDAENMHNEVFTFDVFDNKSLSPQARGENSFIVSGGKSDVAIDYEIYMNVEALLADINGDAEGKDYPPLIFYLSSEDSSVHIEEECASWFDLKGIVSDEDGYFLVATGQFASGCEALETITIHWWWNTSYYVGERNPDGSETGNYYAVAKSEYEGLVENYNARAEEANAFFPQHQRIVTTVGGVETVTYSCGASCPITAGAGGGDIDAAHIAAYNGLLAQANAAQAAVNNSLKSHYDAYDTKAVAKLKRLADSASEGIMIKVVGSQTAPE
jgi:hypothetical protein